jgi:hypothetical protein
MVSSAEASEVRVDDLKVRGSSAIPSPVRAGEVISTTTTETGRGVRSGSSWGGFSEGK